MCRSENAFRLVTNIVQKYLSRDPIFLKADRMIDKLQIITDIDLEQYVRHWCINKCVAL